MSSPLAGGAMAETGPPAKKENLLLRYWRALPDKAHWLVFLLVCALFFFFGYHPDLSDTATHSYILLEDLFSGRFLEFYNDSMRYAEVFEQYTAAYYNITTYLVFAVFQLPAFLFFTLTGMPVRPQVLAFLGKGTAMLFFLGCVLLCYLIAKQLGFAKEKASLAALLYALFPISFFLSAVTGHYDCLELFFLLLGVYFWLKGKLLPFALWFGVAVPLKFFAWLVFLPLLLLREKRILRILGYGLVSCWLVAPTTLLFWGRQAATAEVATAWNAELADRVFAAALPSWGTTLPLFPILYVALCFVAWLVRPGEDRMPPLGIWYALAALGLFYTLVFWHPQWLSLIVPFLVLAALQVQNNQRAWVWVFVLLCAAFLLLLLQHWGIAFLSYPLARGYPFSHLIAQNHFEYRFFLSTFVVESPVFSQIGRPLFAAALALPLALLYPGTKGLPADRLSPDKTALTKTHAWALFGGWMGLWLVLALVEMIGALHF